MRALFVLSAVAAVVAMVPALTAEAPAVGASNSGPSRLRMSRGFVGVVLVGVAGGLGAGVYETCWSLLMTSRHAAQWQVGLSWTLFAISFAVFSPAAGRLTDRLDRRVLAILGALGMTGFLVTYPFLPRPALLIGLGPLEAIAVAIAFPAAQSLLSQLVAPDALGRAQGVFTTAESAAIGGMSALSGYLFGVGRWVPFVVGGATAVMLTALLPLLWRDVIGRARDAAAPEAAVADQPATFAALAPSA
jgi:DHA1 family multidrug resistance protein-like MFS transporter